MNIASIKLPPLSNGRPSTTKIRIHNKVLTVNHYASIQQTQSLKIISEQYLDLSEREKSSYTQKRPLSTKSISSSRSQDNSCQSLESKKYTRQRSVENLRLQLPNVTAKSWVLYEMRSNQYIYGKRNFKKRQIASLTKMMNLITILEMVELFQLNPKKIKIKASKNACSMIGTTAQLKIGVQYSLHDLYYGMMLSSGNDAAYQIAEIGGCLLKLQRDNGKIDIGAIEDPIQFVSIIEGMNCNLVQLYLKEMNRMARKMYMNCSNFANPHGLSCTSNYSTAEDVAKLCSYAMRNCEFRKIVTTQKHNYSYIPTISQIPIEDKQNFNPNQTQQIKQKGYVKNYWENTNRMLGQGWSGIKTGITPNAGPCLAASVVKSISGKQYEFLVVLLNSQSMEARWIQVRNLVSWAIDSKLYN